MSCCYPNVLLILALNLYRWQLKWCVCVHLDQKCNLSLTQACSIVVVCPFSPNYDTSKPSFEYMLVYFFSVIVYKLEYAIVFFAMHEQLSLANVFISTCFNLPWLALYPNISKELLGICMYVRLSFVSESFGVVWHLGRCLAFDSSDLYRYVALVCRFDVRFCKPLTLCGTCM